MALVPSTIFPVLTSPVLVEITLLPICNVANLLLPCGLEIFPFAPCIQSPDELGRMSEVSAMAILPFTVTV
ncbi:hypothetical protein ES705_32742 [subsurface metagenome]